MKNIQNHYGKSNFRRKFDLWKSINYLIDKRKEVLYKKYRGRCFWHCPKDLIITPELLPFLIKGLQKYGGREGFMEAAFLRKAVLLFKKD